MATITNGLNASVTCTTASNAVSLTVSGAARAIVNVVSSSGQPLGGGSFASSRSIGPYPVGAVISITAAGGSVDYTAVDGDTAVTGLDADYTVTAQDDGKTFSCSTALTITIPLGLSPRPSFIVDCPPTGNASIASSGGALINGATTTLTRARSSNQAGFAVMAHQDADSYGVSGS